jgi:hypothetical protein
MFIATLQRYDPNRLPLASIYNERIAVSVIFIAAKWLVQQANNQGLKTVTFSLHSSLIRDVSPLCKK